MARRSPGVVATMGSEERVKGRATSTRSLASSGFLLVEFFLKQLAHVLLEREAKFLRPRRVFGGPRIQTLKQIHLRQVAVRGSMVRIDIQHLPEGCSGRLELTPLQFQKTLL